MPQKEVQQVKKQHPVPQNIMSVEFKLVGDMTVRQFFYVAAGGILALVFFKSGLPFLARWSLTILFGLMGAAMAFVPLEERGLDVWMMSFLKVLGKSTQMVWHKDPNPPVYFLSDYARSITADALAVAPAKSRARLYEYIKGIKQFDINDPYEVKRRNFLEKLNFEITMPRGLTVSEGAVTKIIGVLDEEVAFPRGSDKFPYIGEISSIVKIQNIRHDRPLKNISFEKEIILPRPDTKEPKQEKILVKESRDINFAAEAEELKKKAESLSKTVNEIRINIEKETAKKSVKPKGVVNLGKLKEVLKKPEEVPKAIANGSEILESGVITMEKKVREPVEKPVSEAPKKEPPKQVAPVEQPKIQNLDIQPPRETKDPEIPNSANIVIENNILKGGVMDSGGHLVEGALILVKDAKGDPERALKTNSLGEFFTATALDNGLYTIETKSENLVFDVINFKAEGKPIGFLTIKAKLP